MFVVAILDVLVLAPKSKFLAKDLRFEVIYEDYAN